MADEADTPSSDPPGAATTGASRAATTGAPPGAPPGAPVVVPRWVQLVMLPLAVLGLYALAQAAGTVLLLFTVAAVIALILNPLVRLVQRTRMPRTLAVITVYAAFFTLIPVLGFLAAAPVADQARSFAKDAPGLVDEASASLDDLQAFVDDNGIDVQIKGESDSALASLQDRLVEGSGEIVSFTGELLRLLVELSFYMILVVVLSIYMLIYGPRIGELVRSVMPPGDGTPEDDYPTRVQSAVFNYIRGQLLFSLIMGTSAGAALWVFGTLGIFPEGRTYALAFGAFFGLMELIPYVGPVLGAVPPVLVALVQDPLTAVWVALLFVALQQLEGHIVAPNVFGHALRLNPLLVILALLLGGEIYGFVGALVALPIAAVLRETVVYLRRHLIFEPWGTPGTLALVQPAPAPASAPEPAAKKSPAPQTAAPTSSEDGEEETERLASARRRPAAKAQPDPDG
ncbi:MAG: AI-2E family transporter [Actinomycetota bacterium]|nr:AI-2E family transporter [Actinomycetota bacterium]